MVERLCLLGEGGLLPRSAGRGRQRLRRASACEAAAERGRRVCGCAAAAGRLLSKSHNHKVSFHDRWRLNTCSQTDAAACKVAS